MPEESVAQFGLAEGAPRSKPFGWDFPRSAITVRGIVEAAGERGMAEPAVLAGSGLKPSDLRDPTIEIEAGQELAVIRNVLDAIGDPAPLGAEAGIKGPLRMLGFLGFAMISSRTAREALAIFNRLGYGKVAPLFLRPRVAKDPAGITIIYEDDEVPDDVREFLTGRDLALFLSLLPIMFGAIPRVSVSTVLSEHRGRSFAGALPGWSVETGALHNSIRLDNAALARPLPNADEHTIRVCERNIADVLEMRDHRTGVVPRVRSAMLREHARIPSLVHLAAEQHVDPRTLRRQLAAEGTSFRELANGVRKTLAIELLNKGLTVQQVADRLGYCDPATFTRAFKRWTGRTPGSVTRDEPAQVQLATIREGSG